MKQATLDKLQVAARDGQCRLFYLDEAGICAAPPVQRSWSPRGLPHTIEPNSHCGRSIVGALDFGKNALIHASHTRTVKGPHVVEFIEALVQQGDGKPTVIVLDNASIQIVPRQTVQLAARDDATTTMSPAKPAKRVKVARLSGNHVNERVALNRATHPVTRPVPSTQSEWTANAPSSHNTALTDDAPWLNWSVPQQRPTMRAATPADHSWNDHMTQRRITDDPAAFHVGSSGK